MNISITFSEGESKEFEDNFTRAIHFSQKARLAFTDQKGESLGFIGDAQRVTTVTSEGSATFVIANARKTVGGAL